MARKTNLWRGIILLLFFWFTRTIAIDGFPLFIDEATHIEYGEKMRQIGSPIYQDIGRVFTIWWLLPFQPLAAAPVWVARIAMVLALMPGMAALFSLGRLAAGRRGMVLAGVLLIFSNYLLFFQRLALADPITSSALAVATYFAYRLRDRARLVEAVIVGLALFAAYGAKIASLYYLVIPFAAFIALKPKDRSWAAQLRWLVVAAGTALGLIVLMNVGLFVIGHCSLCYHIRLSVTGSATETVEALNIGALLVEMGHKIIASVENLAFYSGPVFFVLLLVAGLVLVIRRKFFLPLVLLVPLLAIWFQTAQNSRYFVMPMMLLLTMGGIVLAQLLNGQRRLIQIAVGVLVAVWIALQWGPFFAATVADPVNLPLTALDRGEHITSDAAGTGFREVGAFLAAYEPVEVYGIVANCQSLRYTTWDVLPVTCHRVNPNGEDIPALYQWMVLGQSQDGHFAIVEDSPYVPDEAPGELLTVIEHESGRPRLAIYELNP